MPNKFTSILLFLILASCSTKSKNLHENKTTNIKLNSKLNFENFIVTKVKIGDIKVGMKISNIQNLQLIFEVKEHEAFDFGFDGGGIAYIYLQGRI